MQYLFLMFLFSRNHGALLWKATVSQDGGSMDPYITNYKSMSQESYSSRNIYIGFCVNKYNLHKPLIASME